MVCLCKSLDTHFQKEMHQVLSERSDLLLAVVVKILRQKTFMNSISFGTD